MTPQEMLNQYSGEYLDRDDIESLVIKYAAQEAIAFGEWQRANFIEWNGKEGERYFHKTAGEPLPYNPKTTQELYDLYTKIKEK